MSNYETRAIMVLVAPEGERLFTDRGFSIEIVDESGGEYLVLRNADSSDKVAIEPVNGRTCATPWTRCLPRCGSIEKNDGLGYP